MHELKRGVTLYEAKGGYDKQVRCEVVTILAKNEYALLMEHIRKMIQVLLLQSALSVRLSEAGIPSMVFGTNNLM